MSREIFYETPEFRQLQELMAKFEAMSQEEAMRAEDAWEDAVQKHYKDEIEESKVLPGSSPPLALLTCERRKQGVSAFVRALQHAVSLGYSVTSLGDDVLKFGHGPE